MNKFSTALEEVTTDLGVSADDSTTRPGLLTLFIEAQDIDGLLRRQHEDIAAVMTRLRTYDPEYPFALPTKLCEQTLHEVDERNALTAEKVRALKVLVRVVLGAQAAASFAKKTA
jgi:hypothetical protein